MTFTKLLMIDCVLYVCANFLNWTSSGWPKEIPRTVNLSVAVKLFAIVFMSSLRLLIVSSSIGQMVMIDQTTLIKLID